MISKSIHGSNWIQLFAAGFLAFVICGACLGQAPQLNDGKKIYQDQCADCHGASGEGVEGAYESRLSGVLTLYELENYITQTMPEEDATACVGGDAKAVAKYVYDEFYSIEALNRISPPKYVFSRRTNQQFKNSVADLFSPSLRRQEILPREHGLNGTYYKSRSMRNSNKVNERIDSTIDFDFGEGSPEKIKGKEFSIRWSGSLIAAESGQYTIIVESANSVRLRLNSSRKPLIDANVVSGDRAEYRARISLLAGRLYSLGIDVSRFKEKNGFVRISWIRPNGHQEVIPATNLCTERSAPIATLSTEFPPDDQSYGYPRGISISKEWTSAVSKAAIEAGQFVVRYFDVFVKPNQDFKERRKTAKAFCVKIAENAFGGELSPTLKKTYVDAYFDNAELDLREATKRAIVLILESPRFLYVDLKKGQADPAYSLARIYWDSIPNPQLLEAQSKNRLQDGSSIDSILDRMLDDRRARIKVEQFFCHYFKLDELHNLEKDPASFKGFDKQLVEDLKKSFQIQVSELAWRKNFLIKDLFSTDSIFANQRIAKFYEIQIPTSQTKSIGGFVEVKTSSRPGILSHPLLMAGFAYSKSSSPIHRGVFLAKNILGRRLNPPPDAFPPFDGEIAKKWTTREKVEFQTKPISCQRCHGLINQLGFAFEKYDAVGKIRTHDNGKPVNADGKYRTEDGKLIEYKDASELVDFLVDSSTVRKHFAKELFQFMVKQPVAAYGPNASKRLESIQQKQDINLRDLLKEIGKIATFEKRIQ